MKILISVIETVLKSKGYEVKEMIGKGSTASVYRVTNLAEGSEYACKISENTRWIRPEAELLSKIHHPLFPKWKDYWEEEKTGYLVMEYISGENLEKHLRKKGVVSQEEAVKIAMELADGLRYLHERMHGDIYRDLKPENIMLQENAQVRLLDLGTAAIPNDWCAGTLAYASPEQKMILEEKGESGVLLPASDVYSLGKVMHYMLTGQNPLYEVKEHKPARAYNPRIWRGLSEIVDKCMKKQPQERIQGMRELMCELSCYYRQKKSSIIRQEMKACLSRFRRQKVFYVKTIWLSDYKNPLTLSEKHNIM